MSDDIKMTGKKRKETGLNDFQFEPNINKPVKKQKDNPNLKQNKTTEEKNAINIVTIKEIKKKIILPIAQYYSNKKKENWNSKQIPDLKKYCDSLGIQAECNYKLLTGLISSDFDAFIQYYPKFQFTLEIEQRKAIQKLIKNCDNYPLIKNNFIKDDLKSIRELFLKICDLILNINLKNNDYLETLQSQIIEQGVFIQNSIEFFIPVNFGNLDLKYNKLIIDTVCFIFGKNMGKLNELSADEKK